MTRSLSPGWGPWTYVMECTRPPPGEAELHTRERDVWETSLPKSECCSITNPAQLAFPRPVFVL